MVFSFTGPPQGAVVVQNASGFRCFRRAQHGVVQNASQFDGFGGILAISGRLRRILDQASGKTPDPPETQTHFGPPSSSTTGPPVRASRLQSLTRAVVLQTPGRRATGSNNVPADSAEVPRCAPS